MRTFVTAALLVVAGCVPLTPRVVTRDTTPEELVARVRRAAIEEEWGDIYDRLSANARKKVSRLTFVIGFGTERAPPPHGYRLADVVARGSFDGCLPDPDDASRAIVFYSYKEPGAPRLDAKVLIVREESGWKIEGPL